MTTSILKSLNNEQKCSFLGLDSVQRFLSQYWSQSERQYFEMVLNDVPEQERVSFEEKIYTMGALNPHSFFNKPPILDAPLPGNTPIQKTEDDVKTTP